MPQLLVRNVEDFVVRNLRRRAALHGVSAEEEHRRILREALMQAEDGRKTLIGFLLDGDGVAPEMELEIDRPDEVDDHRDVDF